MPTSLEKSERPSTNWNVIGGPRVFHGRRSTGKSIRLVRDRERWFGFSRDASPDCDWQICRAVRTECAKTVIKL